MSPADLAAMHAAAFGAAVAGPVAGTVAGTVAGRPWSAAEFDSLLRDRFVFLCPSNERDAGFALGRAVAGEAELLTLAVRPERRRAGLGRRLLHAFEDGARARGAREAFLEVADGNRPAIGLYSSEGYTERGRRPGYYALGEGGRADALILARALTS